jgi:putative endonuclease
MKQFFVYLLCSKHNGTLYTGVTSDLPKRIYQHKNDLVPGFTENYGVHQLVWYEPHENAASALTRERQMKKWKRAWKINLIEQGNPTWDDLYECL